MVYSAKSLVLWSQIGSKLSEFLLEICTAYTDTSAQTTTRPLSLQESDGVVFDSMRSGAVQC